MTEGLKTVGIIPARWGSTRFPGKPLAPILGRPMIQWVVEAALKAVRLSQVIVATDDSRILDAVKGFGGCAELTSDQHRTGSDRIAEVAARGQWDLVVNIQGDEPLIDPADIDRAVKGLADNPDIPVSTLMAPVKTEDERDDVNVVKVVTDARGRALYFSRSPIPHNRDGGGEAPLEGVFRHLGLYAYRSSFLREFTRMPSTPLEELEKLEQLRILESGFPILVLNTENRSPGVDRPEDIEKLETLLAKQE
ncbi:MAG: 3-deoxy-manno-octulosonate cytidylyltransferase [Nitrospina sp.]|nr:3-deoxy-manno-octulosonate cytidylyltransferase [Nitrospina sp.]